MQLNHDLIPSFTFMRKMTEQKGPMIAFFMEKSKTTNEEEMCAFLHFQVKSEGQNLDQAVGFLEGTGGWYCTRGEEEDATGATTSVSQPEMVSKGDEP